MPTRIALFLAALSFACADPTTPPTPDAGSPPDAGPMCGSTRCTGENVCLEHATKPGVAACLEPGTCDAKPAGADPFGDALGAIGLTRCTATQVENFLDGAAPPKVARDPLHRLPHFDRMHSHPLELPAWSDDVARSLAPSAAGRVSGAIAAAALRLGYTLDPTPTGHTVSDEKPLASAVAELVTELGGTPDPGALDADAEDLPEDVQRAAAALVLALRDAAVVRDDVFKPVAELAFMQRCGPSLILPTANCGTFNPTDEDVRILFDGGVDLERLYQAAYDLALAAESLPTENLKGKTGFAFNQPTPLGRIVIADAQAQTFEPTLGQIALLFDLGGDDTYRNAAGATGGPREGVSLQLDLGGNDTYTYKEVSARGDTGRLPSDGEGRNRAGDVTQGQTALSLSTIERQGAASGGIGLLFDLAGDDTYRSLRESQGFASFGVGVLWDRAGDDKYTAEAGAQGAAMAGIGLLLDDAGNDERRISSDGQGFGYALGFGAVADGAGDDVYFADPGDPANGGDPLYFTPQMPGRANASFAQGAGFGRRDDTAQAPLSGGLGVCADFGGGNDSYTAGVFAQATGYFFGTGVLFDEGGDDLYDGYWYVRGADAHFALATFHDLAGNDRHNTRTPGVATSMGVGHDHSVGWLIDDAGDDTYVAPSLSMGSGNACGWGFFVDGAGNDRYDAHGLSLGRFGDPLDCSYVRQPTRGTLVDAGGTDTYTIDGEPVTREKLTTTATPREDAPLASAAMVDGEGVALVLP